MKNNLFSRVAFFSAAAAASASSMAAVDYTALTTAFDLTSTETAVLAIAATLAGLFVAIRGAKTVLGMIRGR